MAMMKCGTCEHRSSDGAPKIFEVVTTVVPLASSYDQCSSGSDFFLADLQRKLTARCDACGGGSKKAEIMTYFTGGLTLIQPNSIN